MTSNDQNLTPEQKKPVDVVEQVRDADIENEPAVAPTFSTPAGVKDNSDRPVVNPVTGGAL